MLLHTPQVVVVAAGFCTRARRVASVLPPGTPLPVFFEVRWCAMLEAHIRI